MADWQDCGEAGQGAYGGSYTASVAARHRTTSRDTARSSKEHENWSDSEGKGHELNRDKSYYESMADVAQKQADYFEGRGNDNARDASQHLADYYTDKANE
jgi:hypothetical protein